MNFYPERLPELLPYMGKGMLAIFISSWPSLS